MRYKTVFLDFDDTLIDTQAYATKCLKGLYSDFDLDKYFENVEEFLTIYHTNTRKLWEDYALGLVDKPTLLRQRFEKPFLHVPHLIGNFTANLNDEFMERVVFIDLVIEGAKELLEYLKKKGYKLVMLSNGFTEIQYKKIKNVGFENIFDVVILSDVVGVNKPDSKIFEYALEKSATRAKETIMIGDSYLADIQGAMDAGIDQIWYNPNGVKADKIPTYEISHLDQIKNIL